MDNQKRINMAKAAQSIRQAAFASNVRWACDRMDFGSFREAAKAFDVDYDWLRRAVTQGFAWTWKNNPAVTKLATFFGVRQEEILGGTGRSVSHGGSGEGQSRLLHPLPDARSGPTPLWHPPARPSATLLGCHRGVRAVHQEARYGGSK